VGDTRTTYTHAVGARKRHREIGLGDNSTQLILNQTILGSAAAALGLFDEALESLELAVAVGGPEAASVMRAKAMLALAGVWMTMGHADKAGSLVADVPDGIGPGMRMQAHWTLARAAEQDGASAEGHWSRFDELSRAHPNLPFSQRVAFEQSYRDAPSRAIELLVRWQGEYAASGMHGMARALAWRELARWLEVPGDEAAIAALAKARALEPYADDGLSARCYPPQTWLDIARAYERSALVEEGAACRERGRHWIRAAMARMAPQRRHAFASGNGVNRALLSE
jgi:tetratricopeptide (TPR) repeat protein